MRIFLCADDYGFTPATGAAIRELLGTGRLSATSAMTASPHWPQEAEFLHSQNLSGAIGLHFSLTDLPLLSGQAPSPLGSLIVRSLRGQIDVSAVQQELTAQIDAFERAMGRPPAYIDGHHHVHQLPLIRDVVLETARRRLGPDAFVRDCTEPLGGIVSRGAAAPRALVIALLARGFRAKRHRLGVRANSGFRGVRNFTADEDYSALMAAWLRAPTPDMMIMCHPGTGDDTSDISDSIRSERVKEYRYLKSDAFAALLRERGLEIATLP